MKIRIITFLFLTVYYSVTAQTITGIIRDAETNSTIPFANVILSTNNLNLYSQADSLGYFKFSDLPISRYQLKVSSVTHETKVLDNIQVYSGKVVHLEIQMNIQLNILNEVTITPDDNDVSNLFSQKKISVNQTIRYASTWGDPARMALTFAGVSSVNDQSNELVIRGNSSKGLLWMIEGVEVPNPNHFASDGASGGLISVLNANTLQTSTFYTGAFPANYGNASSGVFDVKLRNGNFENFEHSIDLNFLGFNLGTEGPINKNKRSSYLLNYRFANTKFINSTGLSSTFQSTNPKFQDAVFKINFPSDKNNFSLWGVLGQNTTNYVLTDYLENITDASFFASGVNWQRYFEDESTLEMTLSSSGSFGRNNNQILSSTQEERQTSELKYQYLRYITSFTKRLNSNYTFKTGLIYNKMFYNLNGSFEFLFNNLPIPPIMDTSLEGAGNTTYFQEYLLLKMRSGRFHLNTGIHNSFFVLNRSFRIEPRASVTYNMTDNNFINFSFGLHSRLEPLSVYLFKNNIILNGEVVNNASLSPSQSAHYVFGFNHVGDKGLNVGIEVYLQDLTKIGVTDTSIISGLDFYSLLNQTNSVNLVPLVNAGIGRNYGVEFTIEKKLNRGFYFLQTISAFRSKFALNNLDSYKPSRFDNQYVTNLLIGKEWQLKKNFLGVNLRSTFAGGIRKQPDKIINGRLEVDPSNGYTERLENYNRQDLKTNFTINHKKLSTSLSLDINNIFNQKNPLAQYYNPNKNDYQTIFQLGRLYVFSIKTSF